MGHQGPARGPPGAREGPPGAREGPPEAIRGPPGTVWGPPGAVRGPPGAVRGRPGACRGLPGTTRGHQGPAWARQLAHQGPPGACLGSPACTPRSSKMPTSGIQGPLGVREGSARASRGRSRRPKTAKGPSGSFWECLAFTLFFLSTLKYFSDGPYYRRCSPRLTKNTLCTPHWKFLFK